MFSKKATVTVIYKSGQKVRVKVNSMSITRNPSSGQTSVKWDGIEPRPLLFGIDEVESVWEGKV